MPNAIIKNGCSSKGMKDTLLSEYVYFEIVLGCVTQLGPHVPQPAGFSLLESDRDCFKNCKTIRDTLIICKRDICTGC